MEKNPLERFQTVQISHSLQSLEKTLGGQLCIDVSVIIGQLSLRQNLFFFLLDNWQIAGLEVLSKILQSYFIGGNFTYKRSYIDKSLVVSGTGPSGIPGIPGF